MSLASEIKLMIIHIPSSLIWYFYCQMMQGKIKFSAVWVTRMA